MKYPGIYAKFEFMLYFPKIVLILTEIAQIMPKKAIHYN